jgi:myo-inositol-1(or 4)-monophosphatase
MLDKINLEKKILNILLDINSEVYSRFNGKHIIEEKIDNSIVTDSDKKIELILKDKISNVLPNSYFLGEENSDFTKEDYNNIFNKDFIWAIDPIDGTANFANKIPFFAVSVGLLEKQDKGYKPILGSVLLPALDEIFYTCDLNSYSMQISNNNVKKLDLQDYKVNKPIIMLNDSFYNSYNLKNEKKKVQPRQIGSTVINIIYSVVGRSIGTITSAHIWDFAGSLAIANNLEVNTLRYSDGFLKEYFDVNDFIVGDKKKNWRLKEPYLITKQSNYEFIKQLIEVKK